MYVGDCENEKPDDECRRRYRDDECDSNPIVMYQECAKTCNRCGFNKGDFRLQTRFPIFFSVGRNVDEALNPIISEYGGLKIFSR